MRLTVADTGSGMSADTIAHLSEPFFTTKDDKGTGLGLWISREIIDRHEGSFRVKSRLHSGSVFTVFLPRELSLKPGIADKRHHCSLLPPKDYGHQG